MKNLSADAQIVKKAGNIVNDICRELNWKPLPHGKPLPQHKVKRRITLPLRKPDETDIEYINRMFQVCRNKYNLGIHKSLTLAKKAANIV